MSELKELIAKAKKKDKKAMEELFNQFKPLLESRAKRYSRMGLEYDDVFQQGHCSLSSAFMNISRKRRDHLLPFPAT